MSWSSEQDSADGFQQVKTQQINRYDNEEFWIKAMDAAGNPDVAKMNLISYEPVSHSYFALGEKVGNAFSDGKKLK